MTQLNPFILVLTLSLIVLSLNYSLSLFNTTLYRVTNVALVGGEKLSTTG